MIAAEFQKALYTRLAAASLGVPVYDVAPQSADGASTGAYVTMGVTINTALDTWDRNGESIAVRIHTFSRKGAMSECKLIQDRIYNALHRVEMTITRARKFPLMREGSDIMHDQDGKIHGVCEYRALVEMA